MSAGKEFDLEDNRSTSERLAALIFEPDDENAFGIFKDDVNSNLQEQAIENLPPNPSVNAIQELHHVTDPRVIISDSQMAQLPYQNPINRHQDFRNSPCPQLFSGHSQPFPNPAAPVQQQSQSQGLNATLFTQQGARNRPQPSFIPHLRRPWLYPSAFPVSQQMQQHHHFSMPPAQQSYLGSSFHQGNQMRLDNRNMGSTLNLPQQMQQHQSMRYDDHMGFTPNLPLFQGRSLPEQWSYLRERHYGDRPTIPPRGSSFHQGGQGQQNQMNQQFHNTHTIPQFHHHRGRGTHHHQTQAPDSNQGRGESGTGQDQHQTNQSKFQYGRGRGH